MITYQEFITEIKRYRLRRSGGDPFTRYSDGKQKPIDLSAIHAAGNADAKASVGYKEKRLKQYRRQETARRMDAAGKKLGLPEENVQELFITRKSPEERADAKRKKKVETLIRLMQHAKDPAADTAKTKK